MEVGLLFIEQTSRQLLPGISDSDFNETIGSLHDKQSRELVIVQKPRRERTDFFGQYFLCSIVPRPHSAFHRLQFARGESLGMSLLFLC